MGEKRPHPAHDANRVVSQGVAREFPLLTDDRQHQGAVGVQLPPSERHVRRGQRVRVQELPAGGCERHVSFQPERRGGRPARRFGEPTPAKADTLGLLTEVSGIGIGEAAGSRHPEVSPGPVLAPGQRLGLPPTQGQALARPVLYHPLGAAGPPGNSQGLSVGGTGNQPGEVALHVPVVAALGQREGRNPLRRPFHLHADLAGDASGAVLEQRDLVEQVRPGGHRRPPQRRAAGDVGGHQHEHED